MLYTVEDITGMLEKADFNIIRTDGLHRVSGYVAEIDCIADDRCLPCVGIGVHRDEKGFWTVTDLESGRAVTATNVWTRRRDAIGAFLMKYPAYARFCLHRYDVAVGYGI